MNDERYTGHIFATAFLIFVGFCALMLMPALSPAAQMIALFVGSVLMGLGAWRFFTRSDEDEADLVIDEKPKRGQKRKRGVVPVPEPPDERIVPRLIK